MNKVNKKIELYKTNRLIFFMFFDKENMIGFSFLFISCLLTGENSFALWWRSFQSGREHYLINTIVCG